MAEKTIQFDNYEHVAELFGSFDENIRILEQEYDVTVVSRGGQLKVSGEESAVEQASRAIDGMVLLLEKGETLNEFIADRPDYAMTYGEMVALLDSKEIEIVPVEEDYQEASLYGKRFAGSGGVGAAVLEAMREMGEDTSDISLLTCAGGDECKKALMLLKAGRLKEDFIEGMMCPGGCIGGPSKHQVENLVSRARTELLEKADKREILENLKAYPMDRFSMYRDGHM